MALEDHKLPEDVKIGHITFRKGTSLATLVSRATAWWQEGRADVLDEAMSEAMKHNTAIEVVNALQELKDR